MKVLVTGSKGFIGKHLCYLLKKRECEVIEFDIDSSESILKDSIPEVDWIIHLAGVMRPVNKSEFYTGNRDLTEKICKYIVDTDSKCSLLLTSSTQSTSNNDYGISKLEAESICFNLSKTHGNKVAVFRLTNAFGKWGRPNYNSVVATFCNNIYNNLPIRIDDPSAIVNFIYIDDIIDSFVEIVFGEKTFSSNKPNKIYPEYPISIGELAETLYCFKNCISNKTMPIFKGRFERLLFNEFISFGNPKDMLLEEEAKAINSSCKIMPVLNSNKGFSEIMLSMKADGEYGFVFHNSINLFLQTIEGTIDVLFKKPFEEKWEAIVLGTRNKTTIPCGYAYVLKNNSQNNAEVLLIFDASEKDVSNDCFVVAKK